MRGLIVGHGSIGQRHARNWATLDLGPLAICPRDGLGEALKDQPDLVLVTNPTSLHVETACRAIEAGAHVLVEKPLGHALDGVAELLHAAKLAERRVIVGYNFRFHPGLARLKKLVRNGAIGRVVSARAEVGEYLPDWHPREDYRQSYSGRRDLGGGPVLTFSHELDSLCWVLGAAPRRVTAFTAHASTLDISTEDVADLVFEFDGPILATVHMDYLRRAPRRAFELVGEDGVLRWEYEANQLWQFEPPTRQWRLEQGDARFDRNSMYVDELRQVGGYLADGSLGVLASGEQGGAILALALAAHRSAEAGIAIDLTAEAEPVATWFRTLGA